MAYLAWGQRCELMTLGVYKRTYFLVHSRAVASYRARSVLYKCAMSGTSGSSGFGSVNIEQMDKSTED